MHEMGHAIPALVFTDDIVEVFVGSYGDRNTARSFSMGRLIFHLNTEMMDWQIGMCISADTSLRGRWLIILGGPFASSLISGSILFLLVKYSYSETVVAIAVGLFLLALLDLVVNLYPRETSYSQVDGRAVGSDGFQLRKLWTQRNLAKEYYQAHEDLSNNRPDHAIHQLEKLISSESTEKEYFYLLIDCYKKNKDYEKVVNTYESMVDHYGLSIHDYKVIGLAYIELKNYTECIRCLNEYLYQHYSDYEANCKRGVARMELGEYDEALRDFEAAISYSIKHNIAEPLAHRGFIRLTQGDTQGAWKDMQLSEELGSDPIDPQLYYYKACYYEEIGDFKKALEYFELAKANGFVHHGLEYKIYVAEEYLAGRSL